MAPIMMNPIAVAWKKAGILENSGSLTFQSARLIETGALQMKYFVCVGGIYKNFDFGGQ